MNGEFKNRHYRLKQSNAFATNKNTTMKQSETGLSKHNLTDNGKITIASYDFL